MARLESQGRVFCGVAARQPTRPPLEVVGPALFPVPVFDPMRTVPVLVAALLFSWSGRPAALPTAAHPLHLSTTRLDVMGSGLALEIQVRAFTDDLEEAMAAEFGVMRRIGQERSADVDSAISRHVRRRLLIAADQQALPLTWVGCELVDDAVELYFTTRVPPGASALTVDQRLLLDRFSDQQNLLFLHRGAQRQSAIQRVGATGGRFVLQ
jgi:hypothetical protein